MPMKLSWPHHSCLHLAKGPTEFTAACHAVLFKQRKCPSTSMEAKKEHWGKVGLSFSAAILGIREAKCWEHEPYVFPTNPISSMDCSSSGPNITSTWHIHNLGFEAFRSYISLTRALITTLFRLLWNNSHETALKDDKKAPVGNNRAARMLVCNS